MGTYTTDRNDCWSVSKNLKLGYPEPASGGRRLLPHCGSATCFEPDTRLLNDRGMEKWLALQDASPSSMGCISKPGMQRRPTPASARFREVQSER